MEAGRLAGAGGRQGGGRGGGTVCPHVGKGEWMGLAYNGTGEGAVLGTEDEGGLGRGTTDGEGSGGGIEGETKGGAIPTSLFTKPSDEDAGKSPTDPEEHVGNCNEAVSFRAGALSCYSSNCNVGDSNLLHHKRPNNGPTILRDRKKPLFGGQ